MADRIVYTRPDGVVSVVVPVDGTTIAELLLSDIPADATNVRQVTAAELPSNRLYRDAWDDSNPENFVGVNMTKAKEIAHGRRRTKREAVFEPHLSVTSKAAQGIPLKANENSTASQQAMTDYKTNVDDVAQVAIDNAVTVAELEAVETTHGFVW